MSLLEFLRDRLAEDRQPCEGDGEYRSCYELSERRVLDVEAKLQLINLILRYEAKIDGEWGCCHDAEEIAVGRCPCTDPDGIAALRALSLPYANHPSYEEEWRSSE